MGKEPFDIIKSARNILAKIDKTFTRSAETEADYQCTANRLIDAGNVEVSKIIAKAADTGSTRTWFKRRAALLLHARQKISQLLSEQDEIQRNQKKEPANGKHRDAWLEVVDGLEFYCDLADEIPIGCPIPEEKRRRKKSKKHDLAGLPCDWRERLSTRMKKYYAPFLVTAITGCRPAELKTSILVQIENNELVAIIGGAKVKETQGQPERKLFWKLPKEGLVEDLAELVLRNGDKLVVTVNNTKNFSTAIRDVARREWPKRKKTVTPYCLRHLFSAELKASGKSRQEVAAAMGHLSDRTCQHYATANQAGHSSVVPDRVESAREVLLKYTPDKMPAKKALKIG